MPSRYIIHNKELQNLVLDDLEWDFWKPANKKGGFYCLVDKMEWELGTHSNLILRLDMEKCSWVLCDARGWEYATDEVADGPYQLLFHCDNTIYRHWCGREGSLIERRGRWLTCGHGYRIKG